MVDEKLQYWPRFYVHKCKQRLTRLTQVRIRQGRILREELRLGEKNVARLAPKIRRREETRERKAESAAKVEREIERELLERLTSGAYGERPMNVDEGIWRKVLRGLERKEKGEEVLEDEEELEEEVEAEVEYVSDIEESENELLADEMEDFDDWLGGESPDEDDEDDESDESDEQDGSEASEDDKEGDAGPGKKRKRPTQQSPKPQKKPRGRVEIEYEMEEPVKEALLA
jgi:protein MAK16